MSTKELSKNVVIKSPARSGLSCFYQSLLLKELLNKRPGQREGNLI